ncbi:kinase-like domain-containing protein [Rhizophagus clarus]|uniref:Kinase-like domain-containing protein n=1 Tax=Rhizophagus clarus TaxID=94130 RepID=A0A8H3LST6_9GLOM|nr:kinase-like domain-containing protein [Rhizophagus clarus]
MTNDFLNKVKVYNNLFKIYGISQHPDSNDYVMVLDYYQICHQKIAKSYCNTCIEKYIDTEQKWCRTCQIYYLRKYFRNYGGNEKIDDFIQEMQLRINTSKDIVFEWISYDQFNDIKEIGKTVYSALWRNGPLISYYSNEKKWTGVQDKEVTFKLCNSQNIINDFLNKYYNEHAKNYCGTCIEEYTDVKYKWCEGGFATVYLAKWKDGPLHFNEEWKRGSYKKVALKCLNESRDMTDEFLSEIKAYSMNKCGSNVINIFGISQDPKTNNYIIVLQYVEETDVHCDFHAGNILFKYGYVNQYNDTYISDIGLCGEIGNVDKSKIYGVMPYVAPEVLRGKPYTKAADIYSFALNICNGIKPEINELEAPKYYVVLMKKCWDSSPNNRPNAIEIEKIIYSYNLSPNNEIKKQFKEAEEYRKANVSSIEISQSATHPQAIYISRLLNPFTEDLPKYDDNDHSECLDCAINPSSTIKQLEKYCEQRNLRSLVFGQHIKDSLEH